MRLAKYMETQQLNKSYTFCSGIWGDWRRGGGGGMNFLFEAGRWGMGLFVRNAGGGQVSFSEERTGKREHPTQSDISLLLGRCL